MKPRIGSHLSDTELLVSLLYWSPKGIIEGRTRLEKIVYLLQVSGAAFSYEFFPYHYGPYSRDLAEDLSQLNEFGLVEETPHIGVGDVIRYDYSLTEEGEELAIQVEKRLGREELQALQKAYSEWKDRQTLELITLAKFYMANEQFVESESME